MDCDRQVLEHFLRMDLLSCSEIQDFEACMDWVRVKSKQDAVSREFDDMHLGNLFYEIRFASMTKQELCNLAAKYKSVLLGEISTIINIITLPGFHSENFNQQPRYTEWNESAAIKCNREIAGEKEYPAILTESTEALFSTNVPLLLGISLVSKLPSTKDRMLEIQNGIWRWMLKLLKSAVLTHQTI